MKILTFVLFFLSNYSFASDIVATLIIKDDSDIKNINIILTDLDKSKNITCHFLENKYLNFSLKNEAIDPCYTSIIISTFDRRPKKAKLNLCEITPPASYYDKIGSLEFNLYLSNKMKFYSDSDLFRDTEIKEVVSLDNFRSEYVECY